MADEQVDLAVQGQIISGWTDVRITRRCEGLPNDFEVGLTAINPTDGSQVAAYAGQPCSVSIGQDLVITGNIDRDTNAGDRSSHRLGVIGRGKCADLVDCAAEWKGGQISGASALEIATKLALPYSIKVSQGTGGPQKPIPQFNLNYGETAQEIIDRICTYAGLLYYEDPKGNLVLSEVGAISAASGFTYGQNVQTWSVVNAMDQRFSEYLCASVSIDIYEDVGAGSSLIFFTAPDSQVPRHRRMYLIAENVSGSHDLCQRRALWEASRRAGRGASVTLTADSWRDSGGSLWTPNTLAPVTLPGLRLGQPATMCISEVTYRYDNEGGTRADLTLLPPAAFALQPTQIQPTPFATGELTP